MNKINLNSVEFWEVNVIVKWIFEWLEVTEVRGFCIGWLEKNIIFWVEFKEEKKFIMLWFIWKVF